MNENNEGFPVGVDVSDSTVVHHLPRFWLEGWSLPKRSTIPQYVFHRMSDYDETYKSIGCGKTSLALLNILRNKLIINMSNPSMPVFVLQPLFVSQYPFSGLKHRSLSDAAIKGVSKSDKSGNYLSLRDSSIPVRVRVLDQFSAQREWDSIDNHRYNGRV